MAGLRKVVWVEGVMLSQQHMQQWDEYHSQCLRLYSQFLSPWAWGVLSVELDTAALNNGQLHLRQCQAILPNGQLVDYHAGEQGLLSLDLQQAAKATASGKLEIFLGLAKNDGMTKVSGYPNPDYLTAWSADYQTVNDHYDASRQREVLFAKANFKLFCNDCDGEQFYHLKIAEVQHDNVNFKLNNQFIPAVIPINASQALLNCLNRIIENIKTKAIKLKRSIGETPGEHHLQHVVMLSGLNAALTELLHWQQQTHGHPESLYR